MSLLFCLFIHYYHLFIIMYDYVVIYVHLYCLLNILILHFWLLAVSVTKLQKYHQLCL